MNEKTIDLTNIDLVVLFGSNNKKIDKIRTYFPNLKLVARGNILKVIGAEDQIILFQKKFKSFISHIDQYNRLTFSEIERLILEDETKILENKIDESYYLVKYFLHQIRCNGQAMVLLHVG